jgi:hypothetical protein
MGLLPLTPAEEAHIARAYSAVELPTFHCERVRKVLLTGIDPSMPLWFVCRGGVGGFEKEDRYREFLVISSSLSDFSDLSVSHPPIPASLRSLLPLPFYRQLGPRTDISAASPDDLRHRG